MKKFKYAVVAGTFDHLHAGHSALLQTAKKKSQKLAVGLTKPEFIAQKTLAHLIEPFNLREDCLIRFLGRFPVRIVPLKDHVGPAASNPDFEAIFASPETIGNVNKINRLRLRSGLNLLKTVTIKPVLDSAGKVISSSRIRLGLVDRDGLAYETLFGKNLNLPDNQRRYFKKPLGKLLTEKQVLTRLKKEKPLFVITVGDVATKSLVKKGLKPSLAIFDLMVQRHVFAKSYKDLGLPIKPKYQVINAPGQLTSRLAGAIKQSFQLLIKNPKFHLSIMVNGEEDLAVLPIVLLSPLTCAVIYGQPNRGLVYLTVDETLKKRFIRLVGRFI